MKRTLLAVLVVTAGRARAAKARFTVLARADRALVASANGVLQLDVGAGILLAVTVPAGVERRSRPATR